MFLNQESNDIMKGCSTKICMQMFENITANRKKKTIKQNVTTPMVVKQLEEADCTKSWAK